MRFLLTVILLMSGSALVLADEYEDVTMIDLLRQAKRVRLSANGNVGGYSVSLISDAQWAQHQQRVQERERKVEQLNKQIAELEGTLATLKKAGTREGNEAAQLTSRKLDRLKSEMPSRRNFPGSGIDDLPAVAGVNSSLLFLKYDPKYEPGALRVIPLQHITSIVIFPDPEPAKDVPKTGGNQE
jgi:hypothetical protein